MARKSLIFLLALLSFLNFVFGQLSLDDSCEDTPEPPPPTGPLEHRCHAFHNDDIKCRMEGCEYDLSNKKCPHEMQDCPDDFWDGYTKCVRYSKFMDYKLLNLYNSGGVLCANRKNISMECAAVVQSWGINFAGKFYNYPSRKTFYVKEEDNMVDDPQKIIHHRQVANNVACHLNNERHPFWHIFFKNVVTVDKTKLTKGKQACITYYFKVCTPGIHELSLWVFEGISTAVNQRCFDVKIGDLTILRSVDPYRVGGGECGRLEFVTLFNVSDDVTKLHIRGFATPVPIKDKEKIPLRFCTGMCGAPDETFQFSGASVTALEGEGCPRPKLEHPCHAFHNEDVKCTDDGCQYNLDTKMCLPEITTCPSNFFDGYTDCIRYEGSAPVLYNHGGVLCLLENRTMDFNTICPSATQNFGINFGEKGTKSVSFVYRKSLYFKEDRYVVDDPNGIKINRKVVDLCFRLNNDQFWHNMYGTVVAADADKVPKGQQVCITYHFPVCSPGIHELAVWLVEGMSNSSNQRCFDLKLGDLTISRSLDPGRMIKRTCARSQIILLFNVMENMKELLPKGFSTPVRFDNKDKVPFSICTGQCGNSDETFQLSAASVHQHSGNGCPPLQPDPDTVILK